ncbi:hypothetical protein GCM10010873_30800 [Cypionkella aquatica]|uniref:Uncharacterized protein n=1 Tax=Cypionkella aquatica TaxID=1756042 RepID=A0AA37UAY7_9RHOB|nr:hypothetical protein [Cypionkella aquatica]GLS88106.1 hypothetical protein GCM10010873_30800 [Cypionkella aquatica]
MQMIYQIDTSDYATWKSGFDADSENRGAAGLSVLQIWRDADSASKIAVLFEVNDRKRAQDWVKTEAGFGRSGTAQFLKTA